jgi:hypothetical protein
MSLLGKSHKGLACAKTLTAPGLCRSRRTEWKILASPAIFSRTRAALASLPIRVPKRWHTIRAISTCLVFGLIGCAVLSLSGCNGPGQANDQPTFIDDADIRHVQVQQVLVGAPALPEAVIRSELIALELARRVFHLPGDTPAARRASRQQVLRHLRTRNAPTAGT